jgi:hypothetical protein
VSKTVLVIAGTFRQADLYAQHVGLRRWHYVKNLMDVRGWDRAAVEVHAVEGTYSPDQYEALEVARTRYVVRRVELP